MHLQQKYISTRKIEIANQFLQVLDKHLTELKTGQVDKSFELKDIAERLFILPNHMSDTVSEVLGKSPCSIYEEKLVIISKEMIETSSRPITEIARTLDYDPSNFTKFFKKYTGLTPTKYRKQKQNTSPFVF
ncbi:helix-turn-helix domain-containing protein [Confluentibacter lentus]|uniref:helix-turn-helix domain-containing protein n=1 Tax=Confluentibacter lentus TaxID=1699412 RepID=UPI000C281BDD|nr:helix-turn-helix domain-containing protein [Confluentibacter lentus]